MDLAVGPHGADLDDHLAGVDGPHDSDGARADDLSGADLATLAAEIDAELADLETRRYTDIRGTGERAQRLVPLAHRHGLVAQEYRARLVVADRASRSEDVAGALETARTVLLQARALGELTVAARSEAVIAWCLFRMGAVGDAAAHAVEAVRLLPPDAPPHLAVDHRMILTLLSALHSPDDSYTAAFDRVLVDAERLGNPHLLLSVLNNYAWTHFSHGRAGEATRLLARLEAVSAASGIALNSTMLDTLASILLETGELERAEAVARAMVQPEVAAAEAEARATPEALLTLARIRHRRGDSAEALDLVLRAEQVAAARGLPEITATATMDKSRLLAERGDHRGAYEALSLSHRTWVVVRDREAAARASSLYLLFETEQARQRSLIFEELAERDSLTGLWNRRHLDRVLPGMLTGHQATGVPLSVAIIDVDHFKQINDERNHLTGDAVLSRIGDLLRPVVPESGFTARLGGEEFVVVMPGADPAAAYAVCEGIRLLIGSERWDSITDGLPVTVSIGVTTATPMATMSRILGAADEQLYRAKRQGRDQVQPAPRGA